MLDAHSSRAQRIGAACLFATLALVAGLAVRTPGASADAAQPAENPGAADAPQCGAGGDASVNASADALVSETMAVLRERADSGAKADSEWVVLNNRGYNYGPPPGVRFDALLGELAPNPNGVAR